MQSFCLVLTLYLRQCDFTISGESEILVGKRSLQMTSQQISFVMSVLSIYAVIRYLPYTDWFRDLFELQLGQKQ